jgi:hypothetical protein
MALSLPFQALVVNIKSDDAGSANTRRRLTTTTLPKKGRSWLRAIVVGDLAAVSLKHNAILSALRFHSTSESEEFAHVCRSFTNNERKEEHEHRNQSPRSQLWSQEFLHAVSGPGDREASAEVDRKKQSPDADRVAAKWEHDLREGRYQSPSEITWEEFRQRYEDVVLPSLADGTGDKVDAIFGIVERCLKPERVMSVTAERLSIVMSKMREAGRAETTIKSHMAHLKAALNWGSVSGFSRKFPTSICRSEQKAGKS